MGMSEYNRALVPGLYRHFKGNLYVSKYRGDLAKAI